MIIFAMFYDEGVGGWLKTEHKLTPCDFPPPPTPGGACVTFFQEAPNHLNANVLLEGETAFT